MARDRTDLYRLIGRNKRATALFIVLISLLLGAVGAALGWYFGWGLEIYLLFGAGIVIYNLVLYHNSDRIALAVNRARPADPAEHRQLHNVVEEVAIAAGLPKPRVYVIPADAPNAFATGRNPKHAAVAVTTGLLAMMNREELQGVVAHELAHIRNWDILLQTVVAIVGGLIVLLRDIFLRWGLFFGGGRHDRRSSGRGGGQAGLIIALVGIALAILAPLLVALIRAAISRQREYLADASGAFIVRNPHGLASALAKLGGSQAKLATASDATAHMFIANPFARDRAAFAGAFTSHPPLADRVRRLRSLTVPQETEPDS
ncbi:MAG: M48 family metalloprotease [bacterium]